jgi:ribokinase
MFAASRTSRRERRQSWSTKSGDNAILIVAGANGDLSSADVDAASESLKGCDLILLQLEIQLETAYAAIRFARKAGVKTVLNPAPARGNLDMGIVTQASFLMPNESELAILTDMAVESEDEIAAAAQNLVRQGLETVVVTLGARGSLLATREGSQRIAPVKVQAVDTTGAGDAFIGSFARYLAGGLSLDAALVQATRYSAFSVTRPGAQKSYPNEAEFAAFNAHVN